MASIQTHQVLIEIRQMLFDQKNNPKVLEDALKESYPMIEKTEAQIKEASQKIVEAKQALVSVEEERKTFLDWKKAQMGYVTKLTKDLEDKAAALEEKISAHQKGVAALGYDQAEHAANKADFEKVRKEVEDRAASFGALQKEIDKSNEDLDARKEDLDTREKAISDKEDEVKAYEAQAKKKAAQAAAMWK